MVLVALALSLTLAVAETPQGGEQSPVTLAWCRAAAAANHPLARSRGLIDESLSLTLSSATRDLFPRVGVSAKATTQSDVTSLPISIPNMPIEKPDPEQYQIAADISQVLYDGGAVRAKRKTANASAAVDSRRLDVDLDALRSRVDGLFFGILLADAQRAQNASLLEDLGVNRSRVKAMVDAGVASKSDLASVEVEILKAEQSRSEIESSRSSLVGCLAVLTGAIDPEATFESPEAIADLSGTDQARSELALFDAQAAACESAKAAFVAQAMPRVSAFAELGYGKPALNMLSNDPDSFWVAGLRVNWALDSFYTLGENLRKADVSAEQARVQRDAFALGAEADARKYRGDIDRYAALVEDDGKIIALRGEIKRSAESKYENGAISVSDLLREVTAEHLAMQTKTLHEVQWLLAEYSLDAALGDRRGEK
jgi:outer membrane protein TolC